MLPKLFKASTEPLALDKNTNDSMDSMEESNPDIIPQNTTDDEYQEEERAFESLGNPPSSRLYKRIQSCNNQRHNGCCPKLKSDFTAHADYSLDKQVPSYMTYDQHNLALNSFMKKPEPTAYAKLDMISLPLHHGGFQTLHHPQLPTHMYNRSLRDDQLFLNESISSETPLLRTSNNLFNHTPV
ncbi:unnamed protein product [Ceutorhynchus assimilis]|uniref:Uncharacterized protein n=1 Tax=Ceutorhynchus assimilis TaxID=467358 RepID=A0A9P0GRA8_9CUCU|nr:unnamed protein product [Ceutorhynchus assimilis]